MYFAAVAVTTGAVAVAVVAVDVFVVVLQKNAFSHSKSKHNLPRVNVFKTINFKRNNNIKS